MLVSGSDFRCVFSVYFVCSAVRFSNEPWNAQKARNKLRRKNTDISVRPLVELSYSEVQEYEAKNVVLSLCDGCIC